MSIVCENLDYFQHIAPRYRSLRITDREPIAHIVYQLVTLRAIRALDIGCGTGRYTQLLVRHLREKLSSVYCIDYSANMLGQLSRHFAQEDFRAACTIVASAMSLPLTDKSLNCIFTFNAVHHFKIMEFLREAARVLQIGGYLFIYTRLRSQNSRSVWGRFFPLFTSKEMRLFEVDELYHAVTMVPGLELRQTRTFIFNRKSDMDDLIYKAKNHQYSTFNLYSLREFRRALDQFNSNLYEYFHDPGDIRWIDENTLFVLQKTG